MNLRQQVDHLMDMNQSLKAWDLVKNTNDPLKERVWLKVRHAFDKKEYRKFYEEMLLEYPIERGLEFHIDARFFRFEWLVPKIIRQDPSEVLDIGCADGYLGLTLGKWGIRSVGLNLYKPSIDIATKKAKENNLPAKFIHQDFFDHEGKYDAIVFFEILEHLPDPKKAIEKVFSLLNKEGTVYISTPRVDHKGIEEHLREVNREGWDDGKPAGHLFLLTEEEFRDLLKPYKIIDYKLDGENCMLAEVKYA